MIMKNKIFPTLCLVWHMAVWFWSPASAAPQTFIAPPGGWTEITVSRGGEEIARPQNRHGHFSRLEVEPSDLLEITAAKSGLGPGVSIQLYTLHGGLIDGQVQTTLLTDEQGAVQFTFQLGPASGNYPLILRCRGREEALDFWVRSPGDSLLATNSPSGCGNPPQPPSPCGECPEEESPCPCGSGG